MSAVTPEVELLLINRLFLAGLVLLMFGGALIVLRSGLFQLFLQSFAKMKAMFFRQARVLESDFYRNRPILTEKSKHVYKRAVIGLLSIGTLLLLFSIGLTLHYYSA
ncbi:DUF3899 domain-containing protein [Brevibacillus fluminis]|uniref:DUF3899 domain-containing protein n=1 Tax=Brevibacillus fluminis TaxID=511487 RepID=A0A3M8DVH5_9BACL|nr:DUF3899 domain-containing protein [Brevibacillus fluminis]RNB91371.1 DUF3899 domain-containing protein [Brevibacillus fluminis]